VKSNSPLPGNIEREMPKSKNRGTKVDKQIGARLRMFRTARGWSQQRVADLFGVTFQQVQNYESGTSSIGAGQIMTLCKGLGITPADLLDDKREPAKLKDLKKLSGHGIALAYRLEQLPSRQRHAISMLIDTMNSGRRQKIA
jgi:transcriptional regulator with XRE-family HTH domain